MKYSNLFCVKSIITIMITLALIVLTIMYPDMYTETFKSAVTMVVTFYFAHQSEKRDKQKVGESNENNSTL